MHSNTLKLGFNFIYFLARINSFVALSKIRNDLNDSVTYNIYLNNKENNKNMGATTTLITLNEQRRKYFDKSNYLKI